MTAATPVVYLLHGDDEFAITHQIDELIAKVGDASLAAMNVTRLDGRSADLEELLSIASTMPFLARRRVVILEYPLACLERTPNAEGRQIILNRMAALPETTALVLVEKHPLTDDRDRKKGKIHWLEAWAAAAGSQVWERQFNQPKGVALEQWIQGRAKELGGQVEPKAAGVLAALVGGNSRRAEQEIEKLLAYVNYRRPVHVDDVRLLTADTSEMSIFDLVDAIGARDEKLAFSLLQKLQEQEDSVYIFNMIIRQFRLLLLARELLERNTPETEVTRLLGVHPYVAGKVSRQARQFSLPTLEDIYRRLLEIDLAIKTSQMTGELALETLLAGLAFTPR